MNNVTVIKDNMKQISLVIAPLKAKIRSNRKFIDTLLHIFDSVTDFRKPGVTGRNKALLSSDLKKWIINPTQADL